MSDDAKPKTDGELDLDWDDALADWEKDIEAGAKAQSAPIPQTPGAAPAPRPPAPAARALYRPPTAADLEQMRGRGGDRQTAPPPPAVKTPAPPTPTSMADDHPSFADEDEYDQASSTRVASLDEDLVARLRQVGASAPPPEPARSSAVELDVDGLLEGLDNETQHYPAEIPRVLRASRPPAAAAPGSANATPTSPPAPPSPGEHSPPAHAPAPPPPKFVPKPPVLGTKPAGPVAAVVPPRAPVGAPMSGRSEAAARLAAAAANIGASRAGGAAPKVPPPALGARPAAPAAPAAPRVPLPGGAVPLPGGAVPRPGAPVVARPGVAPGPPSPLVPPGAAAVPSPGAPLVARPPAGAPPTSGGAVKPLADRLGALRKPAVPAPAAPPPTAATLARADGLDDLDDMLDGLDAVPSSPPPAVPAPVAAAAAAPPAPSPAPVAQDREEVAESAAEEAFFAKPKSVAPPPPELDAFAAELAELEAESRAASARPPAPELLEAEPIGGHPDERESRELEVSAPSSASVAARSTDHTGDADAVIFEASEPEEGEAVIIAGDDDGEAALIVEAGEDETSIVMSGDDDGEVMTVDADGDAAPDDASVDHAPVDHASVDHVSAEAPAAPSPAPRAVDRGAAAARRSVRSRKPRMEVFPLVGRAPENLAARAALLERLAAASTGAAKASALLAAAELRTAAGGVADDGVASSFELEASALEAAPSDLVALRVARARATQRREWDVVAALHEREAAASPLPASRALSLAAASEIRFSAGAGERATAERVAARAAEADPRSVAAALLLSSLHAAAGRTAEADRALEGLVGQVQDPALSEALGVGIAARAGIRGATDEALAAARGTSTAALLARARAHAPSAPRAGAEELGNVREPAGIAEAAARLGTLLAMRAGDATLAIGLSRAPQSLAALRTAARAARAAGDVPREREILAAWAARSGSTERATALSRIAELALAEGDLDAAERALRDATLADPELGTLRVLRNDLMRRDPARALADGDEPALVMAAKVALDPASAEGERAFLERARTGTESLLLADVLSLDAAASAQDAPAVRDALARQAERLEPEARTGTLLALAERAAEAGDAIRVLRDGLDHAPGTLVLGRALGQIAPPSQAAAAWLEEASVLSGSAAAYAGTRAAALAEIAGEDVTAAYRRALEADPRYLPALWGLARVARVSGDADAIEDVEERLAEASIRPIDVAAHHVRAGLARAAVDTAAAGEHLRRAREAAPDDLVLLALSLRLGDGFPPAERAERLRAATADAPGPWRRAFGAHAAIALEAAGDLAGAAALLRGDPSLPGAAAALDRIEIALGEHTRVAERRFAAARAAEGELERQSTLEALARLDLERGDTSSAVLSLQAILEASSGHVWALRTLERLFMVEGRQDDLLGTTARMTETLGDPVDVATYLRLSVRLAASRAEATGISGDALVLARERTARLDLWLARRLSAAALAAHDDLRAAAAEAATAARLEKPLERASIAMRAAELYERAGDIGAAAAALGEPCEASPDHPLAWEMRARLLEATSDLAGASRAWEVAANAAARPERRVVMLRRAAVLAQDELSDEDRAVALLSAASELDVTHDDVFDRLEALLRHRNDLTALSALLERRLAAGGEADALVSMHRAHAKLKEAQGDRDGARAALRSALELSPDDLDALKRAAELALEDADFRSAAESLIRIARLRKDRDELRWVFFTLGDIYDKHIPDVKRAEAAFKRVLKLAPDDLTSMERLAALYLREGPREAAIAQLEELAKHEPDVDRARNVRLQLAQVLEQAGDARRAEQVLEVTRRAGPTELATLRAMAEFYGRQQAQSALAMHLNRAVNDFRTALGNDLADEAAWLGLVEVLGWRGRKDAARAAASAAAAIGVLDVEVGRLLDEAGGIPGAPGRAFDETFEDVLAPSALTPAQRAVFRALGPSLEKVLPFDPKATRSEKMASRDATIRPLVLELARAMGLPDVDVWVSAGAPRACVPVTGAPVGILIGRDLLLGTDDREKRFLVARALKIATSQLSLPVRASRDELLGLFVGLLLSVDPRHQPIPIDPASAQEWAKRVAKHVPRRSLDEVSSLVFEVAGGPPEDIAKLSGAAHELGSRAALLATGSVPAAVTGLTKLASEARLPSEPSSRVALIARVPGITALLTFAVSDAYFDARARAGADRA